MTASALPWQAGLWQRVQDNLAAGRLHHALLLTGQRGVGKRHFADQLAKSLLCAAPRGDGHACGDCQACHHFSAGTHPDLFVVEREPDTAVIKVDQIRELIDSLNLTPSMGGYRIGIIDPAEAMNVNAANSLLKTLEEPGRQTLLLLPSARPARLAATIRSRCQLERISAPDRQSGLAWLSGQSDVAASDQAGALEEALLLSAGSPLSALAWLNDEQQQQHRRCFHEWTAVINGQADPIETAKAWLTLDADRLIGWMTSWTHDLIRLRTAGSAALPESASAAPMHAVRYLSEQAALSALAERIPPDRLFQRLDALNELTRLNTVSLNTQLLLEEQLIAWQQSRR